MVRFGLISSFSEKTLHASENCEEKLAFLERLRFRNAQKLIAFVFNVKWVIKKAS